MENLYDEIDEEDLKLAQDGVEEHHKTNDHNATANDPMINATMTKNNEEKETDFTTTDTDVHNATAKIINETMTGINDEEESNIMATEANDQETAMSYTEPLEDPLDLEDFISGDVDETTVTNDRNEKKDSVAVGSKKSKLTTQPMFQKRQKRNNLDQSNVEKQTPILHRSNSSTYSLRPKVKPPQKYTPDDKNANSKKKTPIAEEDEDSSCELDLVRTLHIVTSRKTYELVTTHVTNRILI